jgi:hypothetical protein
LERALAQSTAELARTRRHWGGGVVWRVCTACVVLVAFSGLSVALAAGVQKGQTFKTPFKILASNGSTALLVTDQGFKVEGPVRVDDKSGEGIMYLDDNGSLGLGSNGQADLKLVNTAKGGEIHAFNNDGKQVVDLGAATNGTGFYEIDGAKNPVVQLEDHSNTGYLGISEPSGNTAVQAGVTTEGIGTVRVFGPGGMNSLNGRK